MNYIVFALAFLLGYLLNKSLTKEGGTIKRRLPYIGVKFLQVCPNVNIHLKTKTIRIHHWFAYSIILIITITTNRFVESLFTNGYLIGSIIQGLSFPDWKKFVEYKS